MYLNHHDLSKYWVLDIEGDDYWPTRIWIVVAENAATGEVRRFRDRETFNTFVANTKDCYYVGHNFLSFDALHLNRLWGSGIRLDRVIDTLVLSYLYHPRMPGGHSLEAWGERFRYPKIHFTDFSRYSEEMKTYCVQDVSLAKKLFLALTKRMRDRGFSEKSCELEHQIRIVLDEQQRNGFYFEIEAAEALRAKIDQEREELAGPIHELFPPELVPVATYNYRTKADGTPYAHFERHLASYPKLELSSDKSEYTVYDWAEFNIGSPKQRLEKLMSLGYKPTKKTKTGGPSIDEDALLEYAIKSGRPEIKSIAEWLALNGRSNMIGTWLNTVNRETHRMHGKVFSCGAGTRRMTHSKPNTANVPKAAEKVKYGKECRGLWSVEDKARRRLVGYDASGLEMRCFGHYLGNAEAAELYISGDPHSRNRDNLNENLGGGLLTDRDGVKTIFYAFLYGSGDGNLGRVVGGKAKDGAKVREILLRTTPGLERAVAEVQAEQATGWIKCIDGGYVRCDSPHAALNYKLQSAGGIVMKQASIIIRDRCIQRGIDHMKVADVHDEGQHDVAAGDAEEFARIAVQAIRDAGETLNFSVPLDGEAKIGLSWKDTH